MLGTLGIAAALATAMLAQGGVERPRVAPPTALLVIDIQNFYFEGGRIPLTGPVEAAERAKRVLEAFRAKQLPIVHIRHVPESVPIADGDPADAQYRFRPIVAPAAGEKIVTKHHINSFRETDLLDHLRAKGIKALVIVGMQTHMCVEAAARAGADLGFEVTIVHDACATRPLEFNGHTAPAIDAHTTALAAIKGGYGRVVSVEELLNEM